MTNWRHIVFPEEWDTAEPADCMVRGVERGGVPMVFAALLLEDHANIYVLAYPGGQRFARCSPLTNWATEERYTGDPPTEEQREAVDAVWRSWLSCVPSMGRWTDAMVRSGRDPAGPAR